MIKRLQKKFIQIAMAAVTAVLVLLFLTVNVTYFISTNAKLNQKLDMITENAGTMPAKPPEREMRRGPLPDRPFTEETPFSTRYFVLRYNESGKLIKAELEHIAAVTETDIDEYLQFAIKKGVGRGYTSHYKYAVMQSENGGKMAVFLDCYDELHSIYNILLLSVIATVVCVGLVYFIVILLSKKAMDPVIKSTERQKQFITDASHELKTPITVIATSLKVLEMETGHNEWIDKATAQTEKLKDLVNALITLSRMDEESSPIQMLKFNVSEAVKETAGSYIDFAEMRGHSLSVDIAPELIFCGDEYYIRQLTSILIDNAVKYATKDTPIDFTLRKTKDGISLSTENACDNIEPEDTAKLFDRFYRADKSRSKGIEGFGIGLSIVRSIAEAHNGYVYADLTPENRLRITAELHNMN